MQFSLKHLFVVVTLVAIVVWLATVHPLFGGIGIWMLANWVLFLRGTDRLAVLIYFCATILLFATVVATGLRGL